MRPRYETERDRTGEERVALLAASVWRCEARRLPRAYPLDYAFFRNQLKAWVEIKRRTIASHESPFIILSAHKWDAGLAMAERFGVAFVLLVEFVDGVFYYVVQDTRPQLRFNGRKDRGDWQDMEPVVYIQTKDLKRLS